MTGRRQRLGAEGEVLAARHLQARGFEILDRNFRTRHGELDIVAASRAFLVFCEVKTRVAAGPYRGQVGPLAAVGGRKRRRVRALARLWLAQRGREGGRPRPPAIRFDAIGVTLGERGELLGLEHVEDAF